MKPKANMEQLIQKADTEAVNMKTDEVDRHVKLDNKYRDLQDFQFEIKLREIAQECMKPIRERVLSNH